mgnify:CR=1 FL=1
MAAYNLDVCTPLLDTVLSKVRSHVANQVKYCVPVTRKPPSRYVGLEEKYGDYLYAIGDTITDEAAFGFLNNTDMFSVSNMILLATKIGVSDLFDDSKWIDPVIDYIIQHQHDCRILWDYMDSKLPTE